MPDESLGRTVHQRPGDGALSPSWGLLASRELRVSRVDKAVGKLGL